MWTIKEIVQGHPLGHPSHPMFVHFPVAFYIAILVFDVASRFGDFQEAPVAGTWLIIGAFIATAFAVTTGLVDWSGMARGSTRKRWATRHMIFQLLAFGTFVVNLILRWPDRQLPQAEVTWIVLDAVGVLFMTVGQWLGGILVYRFGMRVSTGQDAGSS
jgi:uncharacterized membrane protein